MRFPIGNPAAGFAQGESDASPVPSKTANLLLLVIVAAAAYLRESRLSGNLYADEVWIIKNAASPFSDFVREFMQDWVHPPLFHFIVRGWVHLFGVNDLSGREVAMLFGILSVPLIYWVGTMMADRKAGLIAASLLALSPIHVYTSQYGRHYSLFVFFVILSIAAFANLYREPDNTWYGVFYVTANVLLVYTHYFGWLIVSCEGLFFLIGRFTYVRRWVNIYLSVVLSVIPWAIMIATHTRDRGVGQFIAWIETPTLWEPIKTLVSFNGTWPMVHQRKLGLVLMGGIAMFSMARLGFRNRNCRDSVYFLVSCVALPFVTVFLVSVTLQPIWLTRTMLVSLPAYYLLIAAGSREFERWKPVCVLMLVPVVWMGLAALSYLQTDHRMPFERTARYLESLTENDIPIAVQDTYLMNPLLFYYTGNGFLYELQDYNVSVAPPAHKASLRRILAEDPERMILVSYPSEKHRQNKELIASRYGAVTTKKFTGFGEQNQSRSILVSLYEKN
jgi:mannosyltransferase